VDHFPSAEWIIFGAARPENLTPRPSKLDGDSTRAGEARVSPLEDSLFDDARIDVWRCRWNLGL
jgi:hypothetical protein